MEAAHCKTLFKIMSGETKEKVLRSVKLTPEENEQLKHEAHQHDMNVSQYIRYLIKKERGCCKDAGSKGEIQHSENIY